MFDLSVKQNLFFTFVRRPIDGRAHGTNPFGTKKLVYISPATYYRSLSFTLSIIYHSLLRNIQFYLSEYFLLFLPCRMHFRLIFLVVVFKPNS